MRIPEKIQDRVMEYYDNIVEAIYVKNPDMYNYVSKGMSDFIKIYQIRTSVMEISFINKSNFRQIENFVECMSIAFYLPGDIILKQGDSNEKFYYIHKGIVEVLQDDCDFIFFDFVKTEEFISHNNHAAKLWQTTTESNWTEKNTQYFVPVHYITWFRFCFY